jgi:hypothetical protein
MVRLTVSTCLALVTAALVAPHPAQAAAQPQAGSRVVGAIGGSKLLAPPSVLSCADFEADGVVVGTSMATAAQLKDPARRARAISALPRRKGIGLFAFPPLWWKPGPGDPRFFYRALHQRIACGSEYSVRYTVLAGRLGTTSARTKTYDFPIRIEARAAGSRR